MFIYSPRDRESVDFTTSGVHLLSTMGAFSYPSRELIDSTTSSKHVHLLFTKNGRQVGHICNQCQTRAVRVGDRCFFCKSRLPISPPIFVMYRTLRQEADSDRARRAASRYSRRPCSVSDVKRRSLAVKLGSSSYTHY